MHANQYQRATLLLTLVMLAGCAANMSPRPRETNAEVLLISFGATNGELKDCGCHSNPRGGLPHRQSLVDSLRLRNKDFLLVDLGDFMNNETVAGDFKTRFIWKQMEEMGYCASTPGAREIANWSIYQDLLTKSTIRPVATNLILVDGGTETPAGPPYLIEEINGVRVGFFSLIGPAVLSSVTVPEGLQFRAEDPIAASTRAIAELRRKAEVVVLLSQMPSKETDELIARVPGIDVALCGRQPAWVTRARTSGETIVQETGSRGMYLGELALVVSPAGRIVEWGSRNDGLGTTYGEKAEVVAQIKQIEDQAREMVTASQQVKAGQPGSGADAAAPATPVPVVPAGSGSGTVRQEH